MNDNENILARRIIALLDLTSLNADDTDAGIVALCHKALTPAGPVAAVCVYPQFVSLARRTLDALGGTQVQVATVCNFPTGDAPLAEVLEQVSEALDNGANEIDVVYPYRALIAGDEQPGRDLVATCKALCRGRALLKVILETGELNALLIRQASIDAIEAGADFIKTSTGKVKVNATAEAAELMLHVIADTNPQVGFKPAGGMRTLSDAAVYLWLAERILGKDWVSPRHLRFGASSLLDNTLQHLGLSAQPPAQGAY
ncbi:deoxyribose-phosphate aldolase [Pseudomonas helleri]|uniref:Deoxyribose-phosphate aldolase n=1 Tax=Pseudomonas helleri TaxID=1608996 RepID=A0A7X2C4W0_9PSED|nr:deoxyribose-phosphate aldolase [Pseudomonas helleri]MQT91024.1 deoxyribose-phosphate aldolase [Pseudomonas helleri]